MNGFAVARANNTSNEWAEKWRTSPRIHLFAFAFFGTFGNFVGIFHRLPATDGKLLRLHKND